MSRRLSTKPHERIAPNRKIIKLKDNLMRFRFLAPCFVLAVFAGFVASHQQPCRESDSSSEKGVVFVVGGVGGWDILGPASHWELPRVGIHHEIRDFVWTHGFGQPFKDLQDRHHLMRKAEDLAEEVRKVKKLDPQRPVYLIGRSGGAGLVLAAAEQLPPDTLERIILLSAAVSPHYDLRPALRATWGEIVSYFSDNDQFVLNWGTTHFGTIDRVYGPSAGLHGFVIPIKLSNEDRLHYRRLIQIPWSSAMILEGHFGAHTGTSLPSFVGYEIAPWLRP
jgi:pimeloyl-ACP methyl ester carboxylesterase